MTKKTQEQPHAKQELAYLLSPRCSAKRKYDGKPCQAPAANGKGRCRMHGGARKSGAPRGNKNAEKHGFFFKNSINFRKKITNILQSNKNTITTT